MSKLALITGAASGLGLVCARRLLQTKQYVVCLADIDEGAGKNEEANLAEEFGKNQVLFLRLDVCDEEDWRSTWHEAESHFAQPICLLLNNAGLSPFSSWSRTIDVNLKAIFTGTFFAMRKLALRKEGGQIVQMSSVTAFLGNQFDIENAAYTVSKWGVNALTLSFGSSLNASKVNVEKIRVNALCPFVAATKMVEGNEKIAADATGLRVLRPEEVADALIVLLDGSASGRVYAVMPDTPLFEVPNANAWAFIVCSVIAKFVFRFLPHSKVWSKTHFALVFLAFAILAILITSKLTSFLM